MREVRTCDFCGGDGRGVYEVLPPEIDGGRRMILCPTCKDTLEDIVAPLLDRLNEDAEVAHTRAEERVRADEGDRATERRRERAATREAPATPDPKDDAEDDPKDDREADSEADAEPESAGDTAEATSAASTESAASETIAREAAAPPAYRKVVRFLQNREFPMDRAEAEGLAAGAYGLDDEIVHKIVEHAIANGSFSTDGDTLTRS